MDSATLAWALAQSAGSRAAVLASAYTGGVTRVTFEGRTVEYRSLDELVHLVFMKGILQASSQITGTIYFYIQKTFYQDFEHSISYLFIGVI